MEEQWCSAPSSGCAEEKGHALEDVERILADLSIPADLPLLAVCFGSDAQVTSLGAGDRVVVHDDFTSNSRLKVELYEGQVGTIIMVDGDGDLLIDFEGASKSEWVFLRNFGKLRVDGTSARLCSEQCYFVQSDAVLKASPQVTLPPGMRSAVLMLFTPDYLSSYCEDENGDWWKGGVYLEWLVCDCDAADGLPDHMEAVTATRKSPAAGLYSLAEGSRNAGARIRRHVFVLFEKLGELDDPNGYWKGGGNYCWDIVRFLEANRPMLQPRAVNVFYTETR